MCSLGTYSTETDNFTFRYELYSDNKDQINLLNSWTRKSLEAAVASANEEVGCDEKRLRKKIRKKFIRFIYSKFETKIMKSKELHQYKIENKDSVYKGFGRSFIIGDTASSFLANGHIIGADKFSHFFNEGWRYYKKVYLEKENLRTAIKKIGIKDENGIRGKKISGIYSYSDLKANIDGMIFFRNLTKKDSQVNDQAPYYRCEKNKWIKNRDFYWQDYIDVTYDQGNNCSEFRNKKLEKKFNENMKRLSVKKGRNDQCPINNSACDTMKNKYIPIYGLEIAKTFISRVCFE